MIILDTNVLAELMKKRPAREVVAWLDGQPAKSIWTTSITAFEIRFGLSTLSDGKRRQALTEAFEQALHKELDGRILDFDPPAAAEAAILAANLRAVGQPFEIRDILIAGTVAACRGTLATRNTRHFAGTGLTLVDPWAALTD